MVNLGKGPHGEVWKCCRGEKEEFAIKVFSKEFSTPQVEKSLSKCIGIAGSYLTEYIEVFRKGERLFLVMSYEPGRHLDDEDSFRFGSRFWTITVEESMKVMVQIFLAVRALHDRNITHGNLKHENIFMFGCAIVADYGLTPQAETMAAISNPNYAAPEVFQSQLVDKRADIWSLGVILYEMITCGQLPFEGKDLGSLGEKIKKGEYEAITEYNFPKALIDLDNMMLNVDPSKRPTILDVLQAPVIYDCIEDGWQETVPRLVGPPDQKVFVWRAYDSPHDSMDGEGWSTVTTRYAARMELHGVRNNESALRVLTHFDLRGADKDRVFVATSLADGGEYLVRDCREQGLTTPMLLYCAPEEAVSMKKENKENVVFDDSVGALIKFIEDKILASASPLPPPSFPLPLPLHKPKVFLWRDSNIKSATNAATWAGVTARYGNRLRLYCVSSTAAALAVLASYDLRGADKDAVYVACNRGEDGAGFLAQCRGCGVTTPALVYCGHTTGWVPMANVEICNKEGALNKFIEEKILK